MFYLIEFREYLFLTDRKNEDKEETLILQLSE